MGNIDTERFYQVTVQMLSRMIENIVSLSGKQDCIHEKEHIFIFLSLS